MDESAERHCVRARIRLSNQLALENLVGFSPPFIFPAEDTDGTLFILACESMLMSWNSRVSLKCQFLSDSVNGP